MLIKQNVVILVLTVTLTCFDASCLGFHILPQSNTTLVRDRRQSDCRSKFACKTGDEYICDINKCDGHRDCADGSDETEAVCKDSFIQCPPDGIFCTYGACVAGTRCNGHEECPDGSDEDPALCATTTPSPTITNGSCPAISIANGQISVLGRGYIPGSAIPNYALVNLTCNDHFALYPANSLVTCIDGAWNTPIPQCKRTCVPRISSSVDVTCTVDGQSVDCSKPLVEGALSRSKCKHFYTSPNNQIPVSRCSGGSWDNPLIRCVPDCGEVVPEGVTNIMTLNSVKESKFPWHVGIYRKIEGKHEYQCGGSIITPLIVITAAHCFTDELATTRYPAQEYYVGAGKYFSDYDAADDKLAQKNQVHDYHIPSQYRGASFNFAGDLAIVVMKKPFQLTTVVRPVCVEWDDQIEREQLKPDNRGSIVGWGYGDPNNKTANVELKQLNAPYIDDGQCVDDAPSYFLRWITSDKFCAGFKNGSRVCKGDSGSGMVFKWKINNTLKYYIRGLVSVGPVTKGVCDNFQFGLYTKVSSYSDFISKVISENPVKDPLEYPTRTNLEDNVKQLTCPPISIEHGHIFVAGESYTPGTSVPAYAVVEFSCDASYALYPANPFVNCINGTWNAAIPQCKVTCPPLKSSTVDVTCTLDGDSVDCNQPMVEGTVAINKCKSFYTPTNFEIPVSTCTGRTWDNPLVRCAPDCGELVPDGVTHIIKGHDAKKGEFPWHIALYRLLEQKHEYQCGGTIISELIIITAAHCFTDAFGKTRYPAQEYYVAAGKYYSDYNAEADVYAQKSQVKEYHIPLEFTGYETNYAGDLAVVVVDNPFNMSNLVQPVCMDWFSQFESQQLVPNNTGRVVGWGFVDPNISEASEKLKLLDAPYINRTKCINEFPSNFRRWVTTDKFCAGVRTGSSVCKGDSGGGLVFKWFTNKYYLRGLVSVGPIEKGTCDNFQYGVYTRISQYKEFILNIRRLNQVKD